jgi:hypothetical protein
VKLCSAHILNVSSTASLKSVLGLPTALIGKIDQLRGTTYASLTLDDYKKVLSPEENKILTEKLENLDSIKLKALSTSKIR